MGRDKFFLKLDTFTLAIDIYLLSLEAISKSWKLIDQEQNKNELAKDGEPNCEDCQKCFSGWIV